MPLISIVMAVRNGEPYLSSAIESILSQTLRDFEFIIIDDGSTDGSLAIANSFADPRINLITQTNHGLSYSLNQGIIASQCAYIARMDADDISLPERLERQLSFLQRNPEYCMVGTNACITSVEGEKLYMTKLPTLDQDIRLWLTEFHSPFYHGSIMFKRDAILKCNLYDEHVVQHIEDILLWQRMARVGLLANLAETLYLYRITPEAVSSVPRSVEGKKIRIVRRFSETGVLSDRDKDFLRNITVSLTQQQRIALYRYRLGKIYLCQNGDIVRARKMFYSTLRVWPTYIPAWYNFLSCLLKGIYEAISSNHTR